MDLMQVIAGIPGVGPYLPYLAALIAVCAAIAPFVPPSAGPLYTVINFIALNFGHARNATAPNKTPPTAPMAVVALFAALGLSACTTTSAQDWARTKALIAVADAILQAERPNIIAAVPAADQNNVGLGIDAAHNAADAIGVIDPSTSSVQQATDALNRFIGVSDPLVAQIEASTGASAQVKAAVAAGVGAAKALLPLLPSMFPPTPPMVTPPAPAPVPAVPS